MKRTILLLVLTMTVAACGGAAEAACPTDKQWTLQSTTSSAMPAKLNLTASGGSSAGSEFNATGTAVACTYHLTLLNYGQGYTNVQSGATGCVAMPVAFHWTLDAVACQLSLSADLTGAKSIYR